MDQATDPQMRQARPSDMFRSLQSMFRRRWLMLAAVFVLLSAIGIALVLLMPQNYVATARIRIDPNRSPLTNSGEGQASLGSEAIETEVSVLNSPELARDVVERLRLASDPEFSKGSDQAVAGTVDPELRISRVTAQVRRGLSVGRDKLTYVIVVNYKSRDPAKAAYIANAFAKRYIETRVDSRIGTAARQAQFYRRQLNEAGIALRAAQQRVAQFRASTGIVGSSNGTITDQQVAPLSGQIATAEANAAEARSNLAAARSQIARGGLDAVSAVRSSTVISDLRRQRAEVERNRGEIEARYGPRHPESVKVRDQLAALDTQIKAEAQRAMGSLQAEADAASAQAASLRGNLGVLRSQQASDTRAAATAAALDQDVENKKAAYDRLAQSADAATQLQQNQIAQAEIIDQAQVPIVPAPPGRALLAAMVLVAAFAAGLTVVILQEMVGGGMRDVDDVESRLGLSVLAALPRVKTRRGITPEGSLLADPTSMYGEALRNARASVLGLREGRNYKVVAVTSALPDEGKSTTSLSLARVSALAGTRTLLVECDVRRAQLRRMAQITPQRGLVEVLRGEATLDETVCPDTVAGLDLLPVTEPFFSPEDLFGGGRLTAMLAQLRESYGLVVLDLPPVLGLADARTVAAQADAVIVAIRWNRTPERAVEQALAALQSDGAPVIGAMFTMVDARSEAIGGMYYTGKYAAYYTRAAA